MVLSALAEGLDPSAAERVAGLPAVDDHEPFCPVQPVNAQSLHDRSFRHLWLPHLQLDELRTRLRSSQRVLWLWLDIDPCTKHLPVLQLGPRTQHMAHSVIHSLRQILAPGCLPLFTSDGLNVYFYASFCSFWDMAARETPRAECAPVAGGGEPDLRPGEAKLTFGANWFASRTSCVLEPQDALKAALQE
jgi:hypothetical protein